MILIGESGATKTEWRIIDDKDNIFQAKSAGVNPYYLESTEILEVFRLGLTDYLKYDFKEIFFYGAGCSSDKNKKTIKECFEHLFPNANIEINHDMLAAARALCENKPGIACILGTGSNSCLYDGEQIVENVLSLGYLLGDEGSGNYIGKQMLINYMRGQLSEKVSKSFDKRFNLKPHEILEDIYHNHLPIRYLAGFSKFVFQHIKDPMLSQMVYDGFKTFMEMNVVKYTDYQNTPVHFTGSVAFYYANILRQVGADMGINIQHIVEGPIAGLTLYHTGKTS